MSDLPDRLEADYYITREDFVAFMRRLHWRNRSRLVWAFVGWVTLPAGLLALGVLALNARDPGSAIFYAMVGMACVTLTPLATFGLPEITFRSLARTCEQSGLIGELRLTLTRETFGTASEMGRSEWYWPKMHRVSESRRGLAVFLTPVHAVLLPRAGFDPPEEYDAVRAFVLDRFAKTRPAPEPPS